MDPEYARRDARAVEDPIASIFDLAESVDRQTPKIRKMLRYVRVFVSLWLLLDFFLILLLSGPGRGATFLLFFPLVALLLGIRYATRAGMRQALRAGAVVVAALQVLTFGEAFLAGIVLVSLFVLGFVILELMRDLRSFFDYFALRHRVIQHVRRADPIVHVPEGKDAVQRILTHLGNSSPEVRGLLGIPGAAATPALLTGRSGLTYEFDGYVRHEPSLFGRLGLGPAGFAIFVKAFDRMPAAPDLHALKAAVEDVAATTKIPPARVLVLWEAKGEESIAPDVYDFLTKEAVRVKIRGSTYACSLELAVEREDGTYDFIPVVVEPAIAGAGRPVWA